MEQIKKMLVYPDNKEVLPHIIHYLSYIGITVNPSGEPDISQQCAHYRASFNYKDVELIPTITSQNSWWLQPSTDAVDDRTVVVGTNEVSFVIGSNEKASESSKHARVYLGLFENKDTGFKITNKIGDVETSYIRVTTNSVNAIVIEIKKPKANEPDTFVIPGGEYLGEVDQIIDQIVGDYKQEIDINNFEESLFLALLDDCRFHNCIGNYVKNVYRSIEDLKAAFERSKKTITEACDKAHRDIDEEHDKQIRALEKAYEFAWDHMFMADEQSMGVVKNKV